jgi:hypothetical protein
MLWGVVVLTARREKDTRNPTNRQADDCTPIASDAEKRAHQAGTTTPHASATPSLTAGTRRIKGSANADGSYYGKDLPKGAVHVHAVSLLFPVVWLATF